MIGAYPWVCFAIGKSNNASYGWKMFGALKKESTHPTEVHNDKGLDMGALKKESTHTTGSDEKREFGQTPFLFSGVISHKVIFTILVIQKIMSQRKKT